MKLRLDEAMVQRGLVHSRSHAQRLIKMHKVVVGAMVVSQPSQEIYPQNTIEIIDKEDYVSRAAFKLSSVAKQFQLDFRDKTVLDVGSSTGGFTDYALQHGANKVIAVDVGTDQLHPSLRNDDRIELHEKTDIRDFKTDRKIDLVVADVSFISLRNILPAVSNLTSKNSILVIMCKPQFEAGRDQVNKGVIKNSKIRRQILADFEQWLKDNNFKILDKADSQVAGTRGNVERFYKIKKLTKVTI